MPGLKFEQRDLSAHIVAEIDSLSLLMGCVYDGMGATIKPMSAILLEGERGKQWRFLSISDATELKETARQLVEDGSWAGCRCWD